MSTATTTTTIPRYTWGPNLGTITPLSTDPTAPPPGGTTAAKADVELTFGGIDAAGAVTFELPAFDPTTAVQPDRVYVLLFDPAEATPTDPALALAHPGALVSFADVPPSPEGAEIVLPRPDGVVPGKKYNGKSVLQFNEPAPTAAPTTTPPAAPAPPT